MNTFLGGQDGSEDVCLTVCERGLKSFEDIRHISLEGCVTLLVQLDKTTARFLQISNHLPDSRNEELGLDVAEGLQNISAMTQFDVCILHNALCQNSFLADLPE